MSATRLLTPRDRSELTAALGEMTRDSRLLAGGTDLVRATTQQRHRPDLIVDLSAMAELDHVTLDDGLLRVGAMATFTRLQADPLVVRHARCLALAAAAVGSLQIRNVATVGGNVANASPCGDSIPALLALGAEVEIWDGAGRTRREPLEAVLAGAGKTTLSCGEAIVGFSFAPLDDGVRATFAKIGSRSTLSVARLSVAVVVGYQAAEGRLTTARVALGAVGETAFRDAQVEASLAGHRADSDTAFAFMEQCAAAVCRSIPGRHSLDYKCGAAVGLADDAWRGLDLSSPVELSTVS
jgi:CO/xanthine dehydrogenase FAD-binding subunit